MYLLGFVADLLNGNGHLLHLFVAAQDAVAHSAGYLLGLLRPHGGLLDAVGNLVDPVGQHIYRVGLLGGAKRQVLCPLRHIFGPVGHILGGRVDLADGAVEELGNLLHGCLDFGELAGVLMGEGNGKIPLGDFLELLRNLVDIVDIFPQADHRPAEVSGKLPQLVVGAVGNGLVQLAVGNFGGNSAQLRHRPADDSPHQKDGEQHRHKHRHNGNRCHDSGQCLQGGQNLPLGHIGHRNPVTAGYGGCLYVHTAVLIKGQPQRAAFYPLGGVGIHVPAELPQRPPGHRWIPVADDGIGPGVHQKDAPGFLNLNIAYNLGNGIQVHVRRRHATNFPRRVPQHSGSAHHVGAAVLIKVYVAQNKVLRLDSVFIPRFFGGHKVRPRHKTGMVQGPVGQRHIKPRGIRAVLTNRVLDVFLHFRHVHIPVLDGIPLHFQHGQRPVHPGGSLLDGFAGGFLKKVLALAQQDPGYPEVNG